MMHKPTKEQEDIIKFAAENNRLKINAAAGAAKSTTLLMVANAIHKPSLYLAFNRVIAEEASEKFPSHVDCRTTHQLAYREKGTDLRHKLTRPKGKYQNVAGTASEIAKYYRLKDIVNREGEEASANFLGLVVKETVKRFESSADKTIESKHVPHKVLKDKFSQVTTRTQALDLILETAKKLWEDRINIHSDVLITHNTYLKLYQLSEPTLDYEIIYLDESQDSSDVVLDIFRRQTHAKLIAVGDEYQAIYGWNGACNAMQKLSFPCKQLTKSFRFGQAIADLATKVIRDGIIIKGFEKVSSEIGIVDRDKPYAIIYRTNACLLSEAVTMIREGISVSVEVDTKDYIKLLESAQALYKGDLKNVKHDDIIPYSKWSEYVASKDESPEVRRVVGTILSGEVYSFISALKSACKDEDAQVILSTAHKTKGREFDQVLLAEDFPEVTLNTKQEEINLLYVAATRAKRLLEPNNALAVAIELYDRGVF